MKFLKTYANNQKPCIEAKLDAKDKKLLYAISKDARLSTSKIAKELRLSRDAIKYRIQKFEDQGVIKGYRTIVDTALLGYDAYHLFLRLTNPSPKVEKTLVDALQSFDFIRSVVKFYGPYDFQVAIIAKSPRAFDEKLSTLMKSVGSLVQEVELLTITKGFKSGALPESFTLSQKYDRSKKKETDIDEKDKAILKVLRNNATKSVVDIAKEAKLSTDIVRYRMKHMQGGIILGYIPIIQYGTLGYSIHAVLMNITSMDEQKENTLKTYTEQNDHLLWAVKTIGRYNIMMYVAVKKQNEFHELINELRMLFPLQITSYATLSANTQFVYTYAPDCIFN